LYFFGFITALAVAFASAGGSKMLELEYKKLLLTFISALGIIFSWAWYLAGKGSKFWYENWENKISQSGYLKNEINGEDRCEIFILAEKSNGDKRNPLLRGYRYSVSQIAIFLSIVITTAWTLIFSSVVIWIFSGENAKNIAKNYKCLLICSLIGLIIWSVIFLRFTTINHELHNGKRNEKCE
jgi:hypothetical protein